LSRNPYFTQFLADTLGRDLFLSDEVELTAAGLAQMAARAAGVSIPEVRPGRIIQARPGAGPGRLAAFAAARQAVEGYAAQPSQR
ncbi:MAG: glycerol kinase, partial [Rhodobacterales bacterium]